MDAFSYYCRLLGFNTKRIRLEIKPRFTQEACSEKAGMSTRAYQEIEYGKANPELRTLVRIANTLKTPLWKLFISPDSSPQTNENLLVALADLEKQIDRLTFENTDLKRRLIRPSKKKR